MQRKWAIAGLVLVVAGLAVGVIAALLAPGVNLQDVFRMDPAGQ